MRALILIAALAMAACATPPNPIQAAPVQGRTVGIATLAAWGTWESELAPAYTRNAVVRQQATVALNRGAISVAAAASILDLTDRARARLDASRRAGNGDPTPQQRADLAEAQRLTAQAATLLEP